MNRSISLIIALTLCILLARCAQAESNNEPNNNNEKGVTIELIKLDVNETNLELEYKIKNNTNHDVWICDSVANVNGVSTFEVYLADDARTLVIRKQLDVSPDPWIIWWAIPIGRYIRLQPGQERVESLSLDVPVRPRIVYTYERANAEYAKRLALEIGYYDEDTLERIRSIIEVAEKLGCGNLELKDYDSDIIKRYFKGLLIKSLFGGSTLDKFYEEVNETAYTDQLLGEKVLRITVDDVNIPYEGYIPSTSNDDTNHNDEKTVTIELNKLDVNETNLELEYKIKNGTDHDVWICDNVNVYGDPPFEVYLAEDAQTLVIRKRLDVLAAVLWPAPPTGRYIRLSPGQEYAESLSLAVPVGPHIVYTGERANAEYATRLSLEIGFYNEDLPGLIRSILEVPERLGCANLESIDYDPDIIRQYFKGLLIKRLFGGLSSFNELYKDVSEEFLTTYTDQLLGEQVLQITVNDLSIPYKGGVQLAN